MLKFQGASISLHDNYFVSFHTYSHWDFIQSIISQVALFFLTYKTTAMNTSQQLDQLSERYRSSFIFGLRLMLGIILLIKGYMFMFRMHELSDVVAAMGMGAFNVTLAMIIASAQLICGLLIMAGLLTRLSCLVLIPILIGAVFYVNLRQGFVTSSEWMLSVVILYLLIFFFVNGAGENSLYHVFMRQGEQKQTA